MVKRNSRIIFCASFLALGIGVTGASPALAAPGLPLYGEVTTQSANLTVRSAPSGEYERTAFLSPGLKVGLLCKATGDFIDDDHEGNGTDVWYKLDSKFPGWITAYYADSLGKKVPNCTQEQLEEKFPKNVLNEAPVG